MRVDTKPTVLIVDDEVDIRLLVRVILESSDLGVRACVGKNDFARLPELVVELSR